MSGGIGFHLVLAAGSVWAGKIQVTAFDRRGRIMDRAALIRYISPVIPSASLPPAWGIYLTDSNGNPAPGRPWWVESSTAPAWNWEGSGKIRASLPWPVAGDGFSTVFLDGNGAGYADGQTILLNEEIASTAYGRMQESLQDRMSWANPKYQPSPRTQGLLDEARRLMDKARLVTQPRQRAAGFDEALRAIALAWQEILYEHGKAVVRDSALGNQIRWGLTLDDSLVDRISDYDWIAQSVADSGANWVRLVFWANKEDVTFSLPSSLVMYDAIVERLARHKIRVMGSILDSLIWPKAMTSVIYKERTRNLILHFKDRIRSWEIASEPNGNWIGAAPPLSRDAVIDIVLPAAEEAKRLDPSLETVATLHWWEGTAGDDSHALFPWVKWAKARDFEKNFDVIALSIYPNKHPMGIAFDSVFRELSNAFPTRKLMLGGFSFTERDKLSGYWWLEPGNVREARKDILVLYTGAACAIPRSVGGGFWWPTLSQMLPPSKKVTPLYKVYQRTVHHLTH